jgi:hypothetical protein
MCGRRGQVELQRLVVGGFCDGAQREQLVDQALGGVARDGAEGLFLVLGERGQRVGVVAEESAQVECEGLGFGLEVRHFEGLFGVLLGMRLESASSSFSTALMKKIGGRGEILALGKVRANAAGMLAWSLNIRAALLDAATSDVLLVSISSASDALR